MVVMKYVLVNIKWGKFACGSILWLLILNPLLVVSTARVGYNLLYALILFISWFYPSDHAISPRISLISAANCSTLLSLLNSKKNQPS